MRVILNVKLWLLCLANIVIQGSNAAQKSVRTNSPRGLLGYLGSLL